MLNSILKKKLALYQPVYDPIPEDSDEIYVKIIDGGRQVVSNNMRGYLPGRLVSFLLNISTNKDKVIYISRHGESQFNRGGKIGGDSSLTELGRDYAEHLSRFISSQSEVKAHGIQVWCSTLKRTHETTGHFKDKAIAWHGLREIEVGICDGMTYEEVNATYPEEFAARKKDKLRYRYPRGESYLDVIARLEPVIFEIERVQGAVLVVGHRAVLRCLFAYFLDEPNERIPYLEVPLHTVLKLIPKPFGVEVTQFPLGEKIEEREDGLKKLPTAVTVTPLKTISAQSPKLSAQPVPTRVSSKELRDNDQDSERQEFSVLSPSSTSVYGGNTQDKTPVVPVTIDSTA